MNGTIAVGAGDGIGPEIIAEGVKVLKAVEKKYGHRFTLNYFDIGGVSIDRYGTPLTEENMDVCRRSDAILFGAIGGPKWDYPGAPVYTNVAGLRLRKDFDLYANIRPAKVYPGMEGCSPVRSDRVRGMDVIVVRENCGGTYFGQPKRRWVENRKRMAVDTTSYSEEEIVRILRVGYELARSRRKKLASVEKSNVMDVGKLWRAIATELNQEYPDVELEHVLADACTMQLMRDPRHFDVLVMDNLFGDLISDEAAGIAGSLGMGPSAQLAGSGVGTERLFGYYESIHGSAPDIAGKGIANPIATILSTAFLLKYTYRLDAEADAIDRAVAAVVVQHRTKDIAEEGKTIVSTKEMGDLIAAAI